jgi:hypothetical protein
MSRWPALAVFVLSAGPAVAQAPVFVQPSGPPSFVQCGDCGGRPAEAGFVAGPGPRLSLGERLLYPFTIGEGCRMPVGCGSFAAERTFLWGSCRQFFTPGYKCSLFAPGGLLNPEPVCGYGSFHNK